MNARVMCSLLFMSCARNRRALHGTKASGSSDVFQQARDRAWVSATKTTPYVRASHATYTRQQPSDSNPRPATSLLYSSDRSPPIHLSQRANLLLRCTPHLLLTYDTDYQHHNITEVSAPPITLRHVCRVGPPRAWIQA
jgi:hypothetical protein